MNLKKNVISIFLMIGILAADLFAMDVYIYGREYNSYLRMKETYQKERSKYDEQKLNSKEFLEKIRDVELIKQEVAGFKNQFHFSNTPIIMKIKELELNKDEAEYFNYLLTLQNEESAIEESNYSFFGKIEENIFDYLRGQEYKGISFKVLSENEEKFPLIELEFNSHYQGLVTFKYKIQYSANDSAEYTADIYKNTLERQLKDDIPYLADFGIKAIESVLSFVTESPSKTNNVATANEYFYIDTIDLSNYLSKEVPSATSTYGTSVAVNDDNSFVVSFDDVLRLYEPNGNLVKDYTKTFDSLGLKNTKVAFVSNIDSQLYVFTTKGVSRPYVFDKEKYLNQVELFSTVGQGVNVSLFMNSSTLGYPVVLDSSENAIVYMGKDADTAKSFDFKNNYNFKVSKDGELAVQYGSALVYYDQNNDVKKVITMHDKGDSFGSVPLVFLGDDFFIVSDVRILDGRNAVNCWSFYSYDGEPLFSIPMTGFLNQFEFSAYKNGILYFTSFSGGTKKLCRVGLNKFSGPSYLKQIAAINARINANPYEAKNYKDLYEVYSKNGGQNLAYDALIKYLELSPADSKAMEAKLRLELTLQKDTIKEDVQTVLDLYDDYGKISAKEKFYPVSAKIEKLLKQFPEDDEIKNQYNELLDLFEESSSAIQSNTKDLVVQEVNLSVLFPVLKNVYAKEACGTITLKNDSNKPITNITVSTNIRKYMDYPSESKTVAKLDKGKTCDIELFVPLNDAALNVQENTNVQIQYTINWECDGRKNKLNITRPLTIYKKSAMCWNDSAMLSCFILPNNSIVSEFATSALSAKQQNVVLSKNINIAATLVDAMGAIPLTYVSDPNVSFSNIVDNDYAVDTVRFPNETLRMKGGDCDDMTTLFCSVLESVGISTAIITVPGHIMAAFDSGETMNLIWQELNSDGVLRAIEYNGKIYIPIETTLMNKGFMECWKSASSRISKKDKIEEFIVIGEQRENYPPVAVDATKEKISVNSQTMLQQKLIDQSEAKNIFEKTLSELSSKTNKGAELNVIAKMYHSLGNDESAIDVLIRAIQVDKNYSPAYKNLANLYKSRGENDMYAKIAKSMPKEKSSSKTSDVTTARASDAEDNWEY